MPRHEPLGRPAPGAPPDMKVRVRRDASGRLQVVVPERTLNETTEAAERPPTADDPRSANLRNVPPFGAGA
jgi:hypothetical protein